jgi:glutathione S-transferase
MIADGRLRPPQETPSMIVVHHLNDSRSQRVLWLLEELGLPYELRTYQRDAQTRLAPPELASVHPLGKSPVISDGADTVIESGAIVDYLVRRHGGGRLQPDPASADYDRYQQWLHYAEGSAMLPLMLNLYVSRLGEAGAPLHPRIQGEIANHLGYVDRSLAGREFMVGEAFSGADVQMSFVGEVAGAYGLRGAYPDLDRWIRAMQARPAYRRALERGGPYRFAPSTRGCSTWSRMRAGRRWRSRASGCGPRWPARRRSSTSMRARRPPAAKGPCPRAAPRSITCRSR